MQKKYSNKSSDDRRYKLDLMSPDNKILTARELISLIDENVPGKARLISINVDYEKDKVTLIFED